LISGSNFSFQIENLGSTRNSASIENFLDELGNKDHKQNISLFKKITSLPGLLIC